MNILVISSHYPKIFGGVSDYTYYLAEALKSETTKITVLTTKSQEIITENGQIKVLADIDNWNIIGILKIIRNIEKINPDYVFLQYVPYMYSRIGLPFFLIFLTFYFRFKKLKFLTTFHEIARSIDFKNIKYLLIAILQRVIAYLISINSNYIVITIDIYRDMLSPFSYKIEKIPAGGNIKKIDLSKLELENLRTKICNRTNYYIVSTIATNIERLHFLFEILSELKKEQFPLKAIIIGRIKAEEVSQCLEIFDIRNIVFLTGYLEPFEIYKYLKITDLFIYLGAKGRNGLVGASSKNTSLIGAYTAGLPVLAVKGYMTDNFFTHKKDIYYLEDLDNKYISNKIIDLLSNKSMLENLRKGSAQIYNEKLSWTVIANKYMNVLN
jgi:glycosyltransferase involved in cell wall biosynthesis